MILQLDSENADRDLSSEVTVLTHTPNDAVPLRCFVEIALGDGVKDLDGTGGEFTVTVAVGSYELTNTVTVAATKTQAKLTSDHFFVPANTAVVVSVTSPNGADTDVDVTAKIYQDGELPLAVQGTVDDAGATATDFDGDSGLSSSDDYYNGAFLVFLDGPASGQWRQIKDYNGTSKNLLFTANPFGATPDNGDRFVILSYAPTA